MESREDSLEKSFQDLKRKDSSWWRWRWHPQDKNTLRSTMLILVPNHSSPPLSLMLHLALWLAWSGKETIQLLLEGLCWEPLSPRTLPLEQSEETCALMLEGISFMEVTQLTVPTRRLTFGSRKMKSQTGHTTVPTGSTRSDYLIVIQN